MQVKHSLPGGQPQGRSKIFSLIVYFYLCTGIYYVYIRGQPKYILLPGNQRPEGGFEHNLLVKQKLINT